MKKLYKCSVCKQVGHNKAKCPDNIKVDKIIKDLFKIFPAKKTEQVWN